MTNGVANPRSREARQALLALVLLTSLGLTAQNVSAGSIVRQTRRDAKSAMAAGDRGKAAELFRAACDQGDGYSCADYARIMEKQDYLRRAARFYGLACIARLSNYCHASGQLWERRQEKTQAIRFYEKGCVIHHGPSCNALHRLMPERTAFIPTPTPAPAKIIPPVVESEPAVQVINRPIPGPTPKVEPPKAQGFDYWQQMMKNAPSNAGAEKSP